MKPVLEVKDLVKTYRGGVKAVDGVSFAISGGTCFGLLGPNGAGKTTTIEVIEDILSPTAGEILFHCRPREDDFCTRIGIQFQQTALLSFMTVKETFRTFQRFYDHFTPLGELIEICRLREFQNQYTDKISGGQRQRFLLALALVNDPELVFLDEPSTGLDPQARRNLWEIVTKTKNSGKTIVLTTHYMEEAQQLCDEVAIMDYGKIIARGTPDDLIKRHCSGVSVVLPRKSIKTPLDFGRDSGQEAGKFKFREVNRHVEIETDDIHACIKALLTKDVDLSEMTVRSPNLEDVFLNLTGRRLRE